MKKTLNQHLLSTAVLLILDIIWIVVFMGRQYSKMVPRIQGGQLKTNYTYAVAAYALMIVGLNMYVVPNIRKEHRLVDSLQYGLVFGIVLYGVYDFTTGAVFTNWSLPLALADVAWGGFVYFISAYIGSFV